MKIKSSFKVGIGFGLTSGVITTLGLMTGLYSGTASRIAVIGGIITIAIADAFSDSLGIHISREAEAKHSQKSVWEATGVTFFTKLFVALSFLVPLLFLSLFNAMIVSLMWGFMLLTLFSFRMALERKEKPWKIISEHLIIASAVIVLTYYVGKIVVILF